MSDYIYKSAKHGRIVTKEYADANPDTTYKCDITDGVNDLVARTHAAAKKAGWWLNTDIDNNPFVVPTKLCLIHTEISEATEGHRTGIMDKHLPHRLNFEVELADALIRIGDLAGAMGFDLGGAVKEKMAFNAKRADHKLENRTKKGGKAY